MRYKLLPPGKRGPFWYVRGSHGKRRFEFSTETRDRAAAQAIADKEIARRIEGTIPHRGPVTFATAAAAYRAFRRPGPLDAIWIDRISAKIGAQHVGLIRHAHLVELANELQPGTAAGTKNRHVIGPAAAVLHYAAEQGWCEYRRFRRFPEARRSTRQPASDETMAKLMNASTGHQRAFLAILYETGLRLADVMRLNDEMIDLPGAAVLARVAKTKDLIRIAISPSVVVMIANLERCGNGRLFPWPSRWSVYRWLRPLRKVTGTTYTPHQSRHALATALLERGVPDKQAAEYGAWRDPRSLHRYQHIRPAPLEGRSAGDLLGENRGKPRRKQA